MRAFSVNLTEVWKVLQNFLGKSTPRKGDTLLAVFEKSR